MTFKKIGNVKSTGELVAENELGNKYILHPYDCPVCRGSGWNGECHECRGTGNVIEFIGYRHIEMITDNFKI